eukprot:scaffold93244_cov44-Tisochrysis_lutea.AAC.3
MVLSTHPLAVEIAAGVTAGAAKTLALYPLDTLTTLREVGLIKRTAHPLVRLRESYAGCVLAVIGIVPYAVCFHAAFYLCEVALAHFAVVGFLSNICCGTCGAIAAAAVGVPIECLKHRIQLQADGYTTPALALSSTLRAEGIRGLYRGLGSTLARNVPYNALHFGVFAMAANAFRCAALPGSDALAGAVAGAITALLTTPLDLINTRLQTQRILTVPGSAANLTGVADALVRVAGEEGGFGALMRGANLRMATYAPSALIFFFVYEGIKRRMLSRLLVGG